MGRQLAKTRCARLAVVFAICWSAALGYQAYNAYGAQQKALDDVRVAGAGSAIMRASIEASGRSPTQFENELINSTTGADHSDELEATYHRAQSDFSKAMWLLFGGLFGGLALITAFYWVMYPEAGAGSPASDG